MNKIRNIVNVFYKHVITLLCLCVMMFAPSYSEAKTCVPAYDFGQGGYLYIPADPSEDSSTSQLIHDTPKTAQVGPWVKTNLTTIGRAFNSSGSNYFQSVVKMYVTGEWFPWGGDTDLATCPLIDCDPSKSEDDICLDGGKVVDTGVESANIPCKLNDGWGLYGLIAKDVNGETKDPNDSTLSLSLPTEYFRTFRIGPLTSDSDGNYFELLYSEQCDLESSTGSTVCLADVDSYGNKTVIKGALYFKVLDSYYDDNSGGYNVTVVSGVYAEKGWIQKAVDKYSAVLTKVTEQLYTTISQDTNVFQIIRAVLVLYVAVTGLLFIMGLSNMNQAELITRLFKIIIVATLIAPNSWDFFNTYLFSFFTVGAQSVASIITQASFQYSSEYGLGLFVLPEDATPMSAFDSILDVTVASSVHKKIWALLLYDYYFVYILFIYVCILILLIGIFESVVLYILSLMNIALLIVISPIFIVMILFKLTKEFFDGWLKQLLANGMLLIIIAVAVALMANLVLGQLYQLLYYAVCWTEVWRLEVLSYTVFSIYFWYPSDATQVEDAITFSHMASLLIVSILFKAFMKQLPHMIDALSGAFMQPISSVREGVSGKLQSSGAYQWVTAKANMARSRISPIARNRTLSGLMDTAGGIKSKVTDKINMGGGARISHGKHRLVNKIVDKADLHVGDKVREGVYRKTGYTGLDD